MREAWVEVRQDNGKVVFTGIVRPESPAEVQGSPPFRLTIGRASSVEVTYRGIPVDLRPYTRDDVARLEVR
ncbi:MAG: DUF4115 domain-containing protein [Burkholderiales bacterium]|nr:MAG: DUF4115 domain-containing protein [Burkholderiales bacterium]